MKQRPWIHLCLQLCLFGSLMVLLPDATVQGERSEFKPDQSVLPVPAPAKSIVLLDLQGCHQFLSMAGDQINWPVQNGALVSTPGRNNSNHVVSKWHFRDADIHVEFMLPAAGTGNSGIYIHGHYEMQVYNSLGKRRPEMTDMGAVYGFSAPLTNACRPPNEWQVYDIRYHAPRRDAARKIIEQGAITAWLNGDRVQHQTRFAEPKSIYHPYRHGTTPYLQAVEQALVSTMTGPLFLQDHNHAVQFRNVWIKPLDGQAVKFRQRESSHQETKAKLNASR